MNKLNIPLSFLLLQNITRKQEVEKTRKQEEGKKLQEDYCNNEELSL